MKYILLPILLLCFNGKTLAQTDTSSVTYGKFGKILVYHPKGTPTSVTLFVSGDGGWKNGVIDMARTLVAQGSMVLGIDVLNGLKDQTCPFAATEDFLKGMPNAELLPLQVGHGFSVTANWKGALIQAYQKVEKAAVFVNTTQDNLPLNVVTSMDKNNLPMVFMISGDGGWTSFDQALAEALAARGLPVVGLDAQKYFWKEKTPNGATADITKAILKYSSLWSRDKFILAGYSFGASIVPFVASRLSAVLKSKLKAVVSLSPDESADFEIHIADMLNFGSNHPYNVIAEYKKIREIPVVCLFGAAEDTENITRFSKAGIKVKTIPGNHHFNDDFSGIVKEMLNLINNQY